MLRWMVLVALAVVVCGCADRGGGVAMPAERAAPDSPAGQRPAPATAPSALVPPATNPATAPSPASQPATYRVVGEAEVIPPDIFQVNDKYVTVRQVIHPIRLKLKAAAAAATEEQFRLKALELIQGEIRGQIERTVLLVEANARLTDDEKKTVEEEVKKRQKQAATDAGSQAALTQRLAAEGTNLDTWLDEVRGTLTLQGYGHRRFAQRLSVTSRDLWQYYTAHRADYRTAARVQMQIIGLPFRQFLPTSRPVTASDRDEAKTLARAELEKATAALAKGDDFAAVAKAHSRDPMAAEGGTWPLMERGSFRVAEVEATACAQKPGEVSKPIETADGLYIVKTLALQAGQERTFDQVQDEITEILRQEQYNAMVTEYMRDLGSKAVVGGLARFQRSAVDEAVRLFFKRVP